MARIKQKGKSGAAKAYITRSSAIKKLQCTLADFRRLCILKGIFPREPRHKKRANKGSTAPTTFYYAKDIAYLAHEPVLRKLREHKAFAKKLSRALGRGEWSSAKSLEESRPVYKLDHIIKERYPTFIDALRDIDDALCMIFMFASLPSNDRIPPALTENCARLAAEWQLYVMHTKALRKIFLSIKGVYYQVEVADQTITWLVPYQFTSTIPPDVDARVMLTFLELYQTMLGFVFFKIYADAGLVYPPPLDTSKDEAGAGVDAFSLQDSKQPTVSELPTAKPVATTGKKVSGKDVRQAIKAVATSAPADVSMIVEDDAAPAAAAPADEQFVLQPSKLEQEQGADLPTLQTLAAAPQTDAADLFAGCVFWLSREVPRPILEFVLRSMGARVGWPATSGGGSPIDETDPAITHVIVDRPLVERASETADERQLRLGRKFVQPQWVADSVNAGRRLLEAHYAQGAALPPHLSPFETYAGGYDPTAVAEDAEMSDAEEAEEAEEAEAEDTPAVQAAAAVAAAVADADENPAALRAAELEAEAAGVDFGAFEKEVAKSRKKSKAGKTAAAAAEPAEDDMNKMLMSNKQRKLYERMKYGQRKQAAEASKLQERKAALQKEKRKQSKAKA